MLLKIKIRFGRRQKIFPTKIHSIWRTHATSYDGFFFFFAQVENRIVEWFLNWKYSGWRNAERETTIHKQTQHTQVCNAKKFQSFLSLAFCFELCTYTSMFSLIRFSLLNRKIERSEKYEIKNFSIIEMKGGKEREKSRRWIKNSHPKYQRCGAAATICMKNIIAEFQIEKKVLFSCAHVSHTNMSLL